MDTQQENQNTTQKKNTISLPAAILSGAVIVAIALFAIFGSKNAPTVPSKTTAQDTTPTGIPANVATIRPTDYVRGDLSKAEVVVFEYSDSDCPFCVKFHPTLLTLMDEYHGRLAWVYRYFPLNQLHPNAYTEALALQCAGQLGGTDAFNKYLDTIINVTLNPDPKSNEALVTFATAQGLDATAFKACMANPATGKIIDEGIAEAQAIGAAGTPFSVAVNIKTGKQVVIPGAYPIEDVRKDIDSLLK